ncbi:MAG: hypothetical protein IPK08_18115 [Bacteroidetes bacterium]|nr:hypothetical protein [Bacteroidota bacterium]
MRRSWNHTPQLRAGKSRQAIRFHWEWVVTGWRHDFIYSGLAVTIFETLAAEQGFDPALQPGSKVLWVVVSKIKEEGRSGDGIFYY